MNAKKTLSKFEKTLSYWENALDAYSAEAFAAKPNADAWSIGQVYNHLVEGTMRYHFVMVEKCLDGGEPGLKSGKAMPGRICFLLGSIPPTKIKVPASPEYTPRQPADKESLRARIDELRLKMRELGPRVDASPSKGHMKHPAFGALNAAEWYQLIDMHFRHHMRQKERLDVFLKENNGSSL